jgi:uncharacterized protein (TIGR02147 family)
VQTSQEQYVAILSQQLEQRIMSNPRYSQRAFARDLKLAPGRLCEILSGKQGLSRVKAKEITARLGFNGKESEHFCDLVDASHARSASVRKIAAKRLSGSLGRRQKKGVANLDLDQFEMIAEWYHLAILELAKINQFKLTPEAVSASLGITKTQATLALRRLVALGYAKQMVGGGILFESVDLAVGNQLPSAAVRSFHRQILEKAIVALGEQTKESRVSNSSVLVVKRPDISRIHEKIQTFWKEMFAEFEIVNPDSSDGVFAVTVQAFELTKMS